MTIPIRILYDEYGRTGNRFLAYLEPIAWAICKKKKVIILFPENILKHYDYFRSSPYISLPLWGKGKMTWRVARKLFLYNKLAQSFYKTKLSRKLGFYAEWVNNILQEPHEYWPKVKPQIQELFTPNDNIKKPIDATFAKVHKGGTKIIGVHIRREDFKTAYGGIYYYEDDVFIGYMQQIQLLVPGCKFCIASNESVSPRYAELFDIIVNPIPNAAGDLYALSRCDYIIGPPSTYNCWASFIGDVPLFSMKQGNLTINLTDFQVYRDEDYKNNR